MPTDFFRPEALAYHSETRPETEVLLIPPRWNRSLYRLLLSLLAAAAVFALVASISRDVEGPAIIRAESADSTTATIVALLPVEARPALEAGQPLLIELGGNVDSPLTIQPERIGETLANPTELRGAFGSAPDVSLQLTAPHVVVYASLPAHALIPVNTESRALNGRRARARVHVGSERLVTLVVRRVGLAGGWAR